ncbi:MAG TPA: hypothetical protein VMV50_02760 [Candidatus Paceibacterota bacterium]|nr:hypothetical protein [Candidatus Paceibacterota bacterium]
MADELSEYEKQEKANFVRLKLEDQVRMGNAVNDQLFQITSAKLATLPVISAIAAALLIVATFNSSLLPLTVTVRVLISVLMLIVPVSLLFYLRLLAKVERLATRLLTKVYGAKLRMDATKVDKLTYELPWIISVLILLLVLVALYVIWCHGSTAQVAP